MDKICSFLGLAKKAGKLEIGEEPVGAACRARQAKLIVLASDAADNTERRAAHFAQAGKAPLVRIPYTKAQLGTALGRTSCAMLAVTDIGLAASLAQKLEGPEAGAQEYLETAGQLRQQADKVLERQREARRHEKNLQRGKKKPWAPPPNKTRTK